MEPWFGIEEQNALNRYMSNRGWVTEFRETEKLETVIADFVNVKHCILVNNGTISLTLAALALGIGFGDEVIVPNYTMVATPNSIGMIGAKPIFVDVEKNSLCIDFGLAKKAITDKTKAIMLVSANGRYPKKNIDEFKNHCDKLNIHIIEDAAQSLGSYYQDGTHIGTKGALGSFSFSAPKIISTGQGGAIVTNDDTLSFKLRRLKDFGRNEGGLDIHDSIGYNFKFTDIQAVIGQEQMKKLPWRVKRKKEIFSIYKQLLKSTEQIQLFNHDLNNTSPWFIDCLAKNRDKLLLFLKEKNIGSRVMYPPINKQKAYMEKETMVVSELVGREGLWLPSASQLSDEDITLVCNTIKSFYKLNS
ncbi:MAG: aminotransferase [Candidatus Marinimicrobia bacterium]|nr:aminotransferase [Candidatus Neomarinimicrobiota bacterium]